MTILYADYLQYCTPMKKYTAVLYWVVRCVPALIMVQTLYFKFTAAPESVYIFSAIHMEPWGRVGVGILELVASVLLLINPMAWLGALLALGLMAGAMLMHLTLLGIEVQSDGGLLFWYAVMVAICSLVVLFYNRMKIAGVLNSMLKK
jgi:uncharacterized membrane protein YphA (DoxX/SURF4 family)